MILEYIIKNTLNPLRVNSNSEIVKAINDHAQAIREIQNFVNGSPIFKNLNNIIGELQDIQGMIEDDELINKIDKVIKELESL